MSGVVAPEHAEKWKTEITFDRFAAILVGSVALLAALLGVVHDERSLAGSRASFEATRLATDISARIAVNSVGTNLSYQSDEAVLMLQMDGSDRALAAQAVGDSGAAAVGQAMVRAATMLRAALDATQATSGGSPADDYVASMLKMTQDDWAAELAEQGHQMDIAADEGSHDRDAVLGLSLLALAGVLIGLAAVLKEGRGGWVALRGAAGLAVGAFLLGLLAAI